VTNVTRICDDPIQHYLKIRRSEIEGLRKCGSRGKTPQLDALIDELPASIGDFRQLTSQFSSEMIAVHHVLKLTFADNPRHEAST
jgi:hypothetical protein